MSATHFVPGLELSRAFYVEAVAPLLARQYPNLIHSAARLDTGSEVLGFDTERSMDHWWGPRVGLYLREQDYSDELRDEIKHALGMKLPHTLRGFSTHMHVEDVSAGSVSMRSTDERPINHMCFIGTTVQFMRWYLALVSRAVAPNRAGGGLSWPLRPSATVSTATPSCGEK